MAAREVHLVDHLFEACIASERLHWRPNAQVLQVMSPWQCVLLASADVTRKMNVVNNILTSVLSSVLLSQLRGVVQ